MPVCEYKCKNCGGKFKIRYLFQEEEKAPECPRCGSHDTQRVISVFSSGPSASSCSSEPSRFKFG